ncbi:HAD-IIA family hydrolase [Kiritimatiella glycovorans]|uniref:Ribonucleotide monophosphatase NagD n=1 Tax=Kiritimatiella glycovorans TaxID=1307763 RepID=A0A0G3EIL7_9BACT|nr:HAD-IIA family hydrolase [Kiritimatiella glycovorans]AKJ65282.1 Ribonucleotide monophosphatase NagD [Kiritimatiella glycovorans]
MKLTGKKGFICDMDGVIYHGDLLLSGAQDFLQALKDRGRHYLFLTNSSQRSPRELSEKLRRLGLDVDAEHFYTSAMATAAFLASQCEGGSCYVIGEPGLTNALYDAGFSIDEVCPDYVVVGETGSYNYERVRHAASLVLKGARLIGTNPDVTGPAEGGLVPATGSLIAPIEMTSGRKAYFTGKPNPLMMRSALKKLGCRREETAIVGDRMDTDIIAGIEAGIETVLVLSGVSSREDLQNYPYRPGHVLEGVGDIFGPEA